MSRHDEDTSVEAWPFEEPAAPPPPLVGRRRGSDANTTSQTASQPQAATPPLEIVRRGSQVPQNASQTPPPLVATPKAPPPLQVTRQGRSTTAPKPEAKPAPAPAPLVRPPDQYVYALFGYDHERDEIQLIRTIDQREFSEQQVYARGEPYMLQLARSDWGSMRLARGYEHITGRPGRLRVEPVAVIPQHTKLGVIFQADLVYSGYNPNDYRDPPDDEDEDEDHPVPQEDHEFEPPSVLYSWAIVRCELKKPIRFDLKSILDR